MKLRLSHILTQHKFETEDLLKKLKEGANFGQLAQKFSQCSSAQQSGSLGEIDLRRLDPDFAEAAEALKPGEISGVVRTKFGYHLIKRDE